MTTVFVEGSSGSVIKMDIPTDPHGAERYAAAVKSGQLTVIEESRIIETTSRHGGVIYKIDRSIAATTDVEATAPADDGPVDELAAMSKQDLFEFATSAGIETKASWNKQQLLDAIADHASDAGAAEQSDPDEGSDDPSDSED